jgi:hypothetical protein
MLTFDSVFELVFMPYQTIVKKNHRKMKENRAGTAANSKEITGES